MIINETKIITTQKEEKSILSASCDHCNKDIKLINSKYANYKTDAKVLTEYVELITYHGDWDIDSMDSFETYQFCSMDCCLNWIILHEKELKSNTREFQIKCHGVYNG